MSTVHSGPNFSRSTRQHPLCTSVPACDSLTELDLGGSSRLIPKVKFTTIARMRQSPCIDLSARRYKWSVHNQRNMILTQLNSTPVYLKAVAGRLKKIQCSAADKQF